MSIYKPKNSPHYHFDFQMRNRRFFGSTGCTSKRDAEKYEAIQKRKAALGETESEDITVDQAFGTWWNLKGKHEGNSATVKGQIKRLSDSFGRTLAFSDISITEFDTYIAKRRAKVKNATVNREIELVRRVAGWIGERGYKAPKIKWGEILLPEPKERVRELSTTEEDSLFEKLPDHLKPVVEFAMLSGQRRTEVITLRWSDVDLAGGRATVSIKGGNRHTFPLTPRMIALIAGQPKACATVFTYLCRRTINIGAAKRVKGQRYPFSNQGWARDWRKAVKDAGITDFRFHDLRHTAGTRNLRATGNLKSVQSLMGHADIKTTARYAHVMEDDVRNMMLAAESRNSPEQTVPNIAEARRNLRKGG